MTATSEYLSRLTRNPLFDAVQLTIQGDAPADPDALREIAAALTTQARAEEAVKESAGLDEAAIRSLVRDEIADAFLKALVMLALSTELEAL